MKLHPGVHFTWAAKLMTIFFAKLCMDFLQVANGQHPVDESHHVICIHFFYMVRKILNDYEKHSDFLSCNILSLS